MANIVPRDENRIPKIGDSFKVGDKCLVNGLYKHACGGYDHFQKGVIFPPHVRNLEELENVSTRVCHDPYEEWILFKIHP